ncbi:MAG: nitrogenase iron-molybdenum cofactor biosynthesis protein NifN, partial [Gammaproteobacteria bacterium]|nr:nitrogenase iron-molybdenum cofactor biosynthesis protein NifN [Gammaproteobacteria bacterium]
KTAVAVAPTNAPVLTNVAAAEVKIGDLEDLERLSRNVGIDLLLSNSHAVESAKRLGVPLLRAGFPQFDTLGGYQKTWIGYRGSRQALFDLANIVLSLEKGEIHPYRSIYSQKQEAMHDTATAAATGGRSH